MKFRICAGIMATAKPRPQGCQPVSAPAPGERRRCRPLVEDVASRPAWQVLAAGRPLDQRRAQPVAWAL